MAKVNGNGLQMETDQTRAAMDLLGQVAAAFQAGWARSERDIESHATRLGNDIMGRAVRADFDRAAEEVAKRATVLADQVQRRGAIGQNIVVFYETADVQTAQTIGDVTRPGGP